MSLTVNPFVEVYAAGDWRDATGDVFTANGTEAVSITHGNQGMNAVLGEPSSMGLTFTSWDWWPDNAVGPYYGSLDINSPIRAGCGLVDHTFPGTVVNGWSDVGGLPVTNNGLGGVVASSDFQQTPGVATHSVPGAGQHRKTVVQGQDQLNGEQYIEFRLPTADVTGAGYEPANLICWWHSGIYVFLRLVVHPDETITMKFRSCIEAVPTESDVTADFTAPITNTGQWIAVKTNVEELRMQAKVWNVGTPEPLTWTVSAEAAAYGYNVAGGIGIRTGVEAGNTNASPKIVEYRNWRYRSVQFYGGISEFAPEPVETADGDVRIPIVANGPSRQFTQGQLPVVSALGRALPKVPGLVALWPHEDGDGSTTFASSLAGHPPMVVRRGAPDFAAFSTLDATKPLVQANEADWEGEVLPYTHTGKIQFRLIMQPPSSPLPDLSILARFYINSADTALWQLVYRTAAGGTLEVQAWKSDTESVYTLTTGVTGLDGVARMFSLELTQNGANVDLRAAQYPFVLADPGSFTTASPASLTLASVKRVWINPQLRDNIVFGFVHIQNVITPFADIINQMLANTVERLDARMARVLAENGITFTELTLTGEYMGPQRPEDLPQIIEECVTLDSGGLFFDGKTHDGCMFVLRVNQHNQSDQVAVNYTQLSPEFRPRRDDRDIRNQITVTRQGGSSATYALSTGRRSILPPKDGGIGTYPSAVTVNKDDDDGLQQIAAWRVATLTVDEPRFTEATIECSSPEVTATPSVRRRLLDLRPGHILSVANATRIRAYSTIRQKVVGYSQEITQFRHSFVLNTVPATPFNQMFKPANTDLSGGTYARADSKYSTLENAITNAQTTFTVAANSSTLWIDTATHAAHFPFSILVGGEEMTVTGITTTTPSFVPAGTAAHADNASVVPGLPAGATTGDLLLVYAGCNKADFTASPTTPATYSTLLSLGESRLCGKIHTGTESAPTVGLTGGAAGVTLSAQMCALRGVPMIVRKTVQQFNGSAQDIATPSLYTTISKSIALAMAWKADDWTAVAVLSSLPTWTEIGEPATTLGNDQGLVWDYKAFSTETVCATDSFVVTGGAAAFSRSVIAVFGNHQTFTVTRGPNASAHAAGTAVRLLAPNRAAL